MHIDQIYAAEERIRPYLKPTPLLYSNLLHRTLNLNVWLKLETQLPTGSFKPRPAFNSILSQLDLAKKYGVVASSSGNFAQGVAFAAKELGVSATIIMMKKTSPYKIERTKRLGAEVVLCGNSHEDRFNTTREIQQKTHRVLLEPYDSDYTIAGDGTIGLEISKELGDQLDQEACVIAPVSGGGLLAGVACALKSLHPRCRIIGVQPEQNASLKKSLEAGNLVNVGPVHTIADALVASSPGAAPFGLIQQYVDDVFLLSEKDIQAATEFMIEEHKLVVEPAGSLPIALLFQQKLKASNFVCIVSGGNIHLVPKGRVD